jgi:hypothetical protein
MRAVVHSKSNLAPKGKSFATGLDSDGRFVWLGDYDITIEELLSNKKPPESQFAKARRLIETKLAGGPVPAADMEEMAEELGISPKTLHRAKSALGVISVKRGGCWYWELPIEVEFTVCDADGEHGQDGHDTPVTTLPLLPAAGAGGAVHEVGQQGQDGHAPDVSTLTIFDESEAV